MEPADWRAQWLFFLIYSFLFYSSSFSSLLSLSLSFCLSTQNHSNNNNKELGKQQKWQHKGEKIIKSTQRKKYLIKNTHTLSLSLFLSQPKITTKKKKKALEPVYLLHTQFAFRRNVDWYGVPNSHRKYLNQWRKKTLLETGEGRKKERGKRGLENKFIKKQRKWNKGKHMRRWGKENLGQ